MKLPTDPQARNDERALRAQITLAAFMADRVLTRATPLLIFSLGLCTGATALARASKLSLNARDLSTARRRTQPSLSIRLHRRGETCGREGLVRAATERRKLN